MLVFKTVYRISVMYLVSIILMRIGGKREVAQLEVSELVTSFMVSEIACMPITDPGIPLWHAVIFTLTVIILQIVLTKASMRIPFFKHIVSGSPDFLIVRGKLDKKALSKADVSLSELVGAMRKKGIPSLDMINYAVQESDGNISIIPFESSSHEQENSGLQHMLICDGKINKTEMETFGYKEDDVLKIIKKHGLKNVGDVFFLGVDDVGKAFVIKM